MTDYSHPKWYFVIGIVALLLSIVTGVVLPRGFNMAILGYSIFPMIYFYARDEYLRDEKNLLFEFGLSFLGFIFLPIGVMFGIYGSIIPTAIDFLYFFVGVFCMLTVTSLLYLIEPETTKQLIIVLTISTTLLFVIIILIKIYTLSGYLGVSI